MSPVPALVPPLQVGRWGEELAFHLLVSAAEQGRMEQLLPGLDTLVWGGVRAVWVNEASESGLPYDIVITGSGGGGSMGGVGARGGGAERVLAYVEVKSSSSNDKHLFEVSRREMEFAEREGAKYHILRVWGATVGGPGAAGGGPSPGGGVGARALAPRVQAFRDPVQQWRHHKMSFCLLV